MTAASSMPKESVSHELLASAFGHHRNAETSAHDAVRHAILAGRDLLAARETIQWGEWQAAAMEYGIPPRTARVYTRIAKCYGHLIDQNGSVLPKSIRKALADMSAEAMEPEPEQAPAKHDTVMRVVSEQEPEESPGEPTHEATPAPRIAPELPELESLREKLDEAVEANEHLLAENEHLAALAEEACKDDQGKVLKDLHGRIKALEGRLSLSERTAAEAQRQAKWQQGVIREVCRLLGIDDPREVVATLKARFTT